MPSVFNNADPTIFCNEYNALKFLIDSSIKKVHVAIPVVVTKVEKRDNGACFLSAIPLIKQLNNDSEAVPSVEIYRLRWFRYQSGTTAIIVDPQVGDVGLAVFAEKDVSALDGDTQGVSTPVVPASRRRFNINDGFYFGGFWGKAPKTYIKLEEDGLITINTSNKVQVNAPNSEFSGNVKINGKLDVVGDIKSDAQIKDAQHNLSTHVHGGVTRGGSNTNQPS